MTCAKCSSIVFTRFNELSDREIAWISNPEEDYLYYFHHETLEDLERSQESCHLCRKIWDAFELDISSFDSIDEDFFNPPELSPIYLTVWLKDQYISEGRAEFFFGIEVFARPLCRLDYSYHFCG